MSTSVRDVARRIGPLRGGAVLMLLGTSSFVGGLVATTSSSHGGASCPNGSTLVAKFEWSGNRYRLEEGSGVTISNGTTSGGNWSSSTPISAIIVKGGPGSVTTTYAPPQSSGSFSQAGLPKVGNGRTPDISNVQFCRPNAVTTTTAAPTTTTTAKPTTTTAKPTTTTAKPTTTTAKPTTTTEATTTTKVDPTTTTKVEKTTTTKVEETTTTTVAPTTTKVEETTTTKVEEETTTTVAPTTTTKVEETTTTTVPATSTTVAPTSTTTTTSKVEGTVVTSTSIAEDDAEVLGNEAERPLAVTGAPSIVMVTFGTLLFLLGATMVGVTGLRRRRSEP